MKENRQQIKQAVEKILNKKIISEDACEWDSLDAVEISVGLEKEFSKPIPDDILFLSLKEIYNFYEI